MRASRVFRVVNRINSVLLLGLLAVGALFLVQNLVSDLRRASQHRRPEPSEDEGGSSRGSGDERVVLETLSALTGTQVSVLALNVHRESSGSYSSKGGYETRTRNLLFHRGPDGRMRWLRADNRAFIEKWEPVQEGEEARGPLRWIRYEIAEADTDGDGEIGPGDRLQVGVSELDGGGYAPLLRDLDAVLGWAPVSGGRTFVFFRRAQKEWVAEVDLAARRMLRESQIPGP